MRSTWYVLESKAVVDPNDCAPDEHGVLRHSSGVAVAMRGDAYSSRGVDVDDKGNLIAVPETAKKEPTAPIPPATPSIAGARFPRRRGGARIGDDGACEANSGEASASAADAPDTGAAGEDSEAGAEGDNAAAEGEQQHGDGDLVPPPAVTETPVPKPTAAPKPAKAKTAPKPRGTKAK